MRLFQIIREGGWDSVVTQDTVVTPLVVREALVVANKFVRDFNSFSKKNKGPAIKMGHPTGSSAYYEVDPPEKEYGDIDLQLVVPKLSDTDGKTYAQLQSYWYRLWDEFVKAAKPDYVHPSSSPGHPIFKLKDNKFVQVDLMPHTEKLQTWGRYRTTPERGIKGLLRGNIFSVLGDMLNMNLQHSGVVFKTKDGVKSPYATTRSNYELHTLTIDIEKFVLNIFDHEFELARGRKRTKKDPVSPLLTQHPGEDLKEIRISTLVKSIKGLAESFKLNDMYGLGDLTAYDSEDDFLDKFVQRYEAKAMKDVGSAKREKAATAQAVARAETDKNNVLAGLQYVKNLFSR
jgi:hypothetical protein